MNQSAYLVIVTWPNGMEGLLFPRPGNVAIADTRIQGERDFNIARDHLREYLRIYGSRESTMDLAQGVTLRLIEFKVGKTIETVTLKP